MTFKEITYTTQNEIAIITFNRPEVMNCVGPVTHEELLVAWQDVKTNDDIKVVVITGAGEKAFCSGGDLKAGLAGELIGNISEEDKQKISAIIKESVAYAFANPKSGIDYIKCHAQEMEESIMYAHIKLYVNEYSKNLGPQGISSVNVLIEKLIAQGLIKTPTYPLFV